MLRGTVPNKAGHFRISLDCMAHFSQNYSRVQELQENSIISIMSDKEAPDSTNPFTNNSCQ